MARNISGVPFPNRMSLAQYITLRNAICRVLQGDFFIEWLKGNGGHAADFLISYEGNGDATAVMGNPTTG